MSKYKPIKIGIIFLITVFIISGTINTLFYKDINQGDPLSGFLYGGVLSIWDSIIALILGAYLGWKYTNKKQ